MPTKKRVQSFLAQEFPQTTVEVESVGEGRARIRQAINFSHLRPGGTVSGPTMMAVADVATYVAILGEIGIVPLAVTTSLNINFLNRPTSQKALVAEAELLKVGARLVVAEVRLFSDGFSTLLAHACVTCSIPPDNPLDQRAPSALLPGKEK